MTRDKLFRAVRIAFIECAITNPQKHLHLGDIREAIIQALPEPVLTEFDVKAFWMDKMQNAQSTAIFSLEVKKDPDFNNRSYCVINIRRENGFLLAFRLSSYVRDDTGKVRAYYYHLMYNDGTYKPCHVRVDVPTKNKYSYLYPIERHFNIDEDGVWQHMPDMDGFDKLMFNSTEDLLQYRSLPRALKEFEYDMRISGMDTDDEY